MFDLPALFSPNRTSGTSLGNSISIGSPIDRYPSIVSFLILPTRTSLLNGSLPWANNRCVSIVRHCSLPRWMRHARVGRRRVEAGLVGVAGAHGLVHGVVELEDDALGAVLAVGRFVFALDDGEGLHDVVHVGALDAVEVEVGGVQLAAKQEAPLLVPAERRAVV